MDNRELGDPGTPSFQVEKYPFFLLNRLVSRYNGVIEPRLRGIGLDIPFWRVLMVLGECSPRGVRDISLAAVIPLSTTTRIVQRMAGVGYIAISESSRDARVTEVSLTILGEEKLVEARAVTAPVYAGIINGVSAKDFNRLITILDRFYDNLTAFENVPAPRRGNNAGT
ncbi:MarR family winged helix-turn-helix transcriptional regulator [Qipengyuania algicida]|uniref:MarR family winged helix-turn-helix transcriptional regulator n=1 Tax=Qipengyuania algicida TaxID=1836209 RepID=UPI001F255FDE|nr:MarR family winged helix-turn-helix transcriptional regulator [Qipengyuania algicida]